MFSYSEKIILELERWAGYSPFKSVCANSQQKDPTKFRAVIVEVVVVYKERWKNRQIRLVCAGLVKISNKAEGGSLSVCESWGDDDDKSAVPTCGHCQPEIPVKSPEKPGLFWTVMSYEWQAGHSDSFAHLNDDSILCVLQILCSKGVTHNDDIYFIAKALMATCNCIKFALIMQQNFVLLRKVKKTFFFFKFWWDM